MTAKPEISGEAENSGRDEESFYGGRAKNQTICLLCDAVVEEKKMKRKSIHVTFCLKPNGKKRLFG